MSSRCMNHLFKIVQLVDWSEKTEIKEEWCLDILGVKRTYHSSI